MAENNNLKPKIVDTYAQDMAKVIENSKGGLIKEILQGNAEHEEEKKSLSPQSRRNKNFMLVGLILLLLGSSIMASFFFWKRSINSVNVEQQYMPIIFNDESVFIEIKDLKKDEIAGTVLNAVLDAELKKGGIEGIYLSVNKKIIGLREFLTLIKSSFIPPVNSPIENNFMLGVSSGDSNDFFILIKMRSIPDIFEYMREWENKMFLDLHGFFGVELSPENKNLLTADFEDLVVENKNARVLYEKDSEGNSRIIMMYVLANDTSVVITNTLNAAHEVMLRLSGPQIKK